jgi:hypothetical protein
VKAVEIRRRGMTESEASGGTSRTHGARKFTHSGSQFVLGYSEESYVIWDRESPDEPVRMFPKTGEGWREAWSYFTGLEPKAREISAPPPVGIASHEQKLQVLQQLKAAGGKFSKPFETGALAGISVFGGNWNEYAEIICSMIIADTLLQIEGQLVALNDRLGSVG